MSERITYLMPVETSARELDYKLTLASRLQAPHRQFLLFRPDLAPALIRLTHAGVWLGQNIRARTGQGDDYARYRALKDAGFVVVYVDEEGAVYPGHEDTWARFVQQRLDASLLAEDDVVVAWGGFQAGLWREATAGVRARILEAGHPRFDLCRAPYASIYDEESERLRRELGRFVLINTNFASANFVSGLGGLFNRRDGYLPDDEGKRLEFVDAWQRALTSVGVFVAMAHRLAARFPSVRFVFRPHPVENHDVYREVLAGVPNLSVRHEGGVTPWLRAADAVIHNGCTTAIESFLGGTTALAFCPPSIGDGESWVPNLFSVRAESEEALFAHVAAVVDGRAPRPAPDAERRRRAAALMAQLDEREPERLAMDQVADAVAQAEGAALARGPRFHARAARLASEAHGAGATAKEWTRQARHLAARARLIPTKFRPFEERELQSRCRRIAAVTGRALDVELLSSTACLVR